MVTTLAPPMIAQPSLLGAGEPAVDATFAAVERRELSLGAWVDHGPGWVEGHQSLFDRLLDAVSWEQQRRPMYDRMVDVPRLMGSLTDDVDELSAAGLAVVTVIGEALAARYGCRFDRVGAALYRHGRDSVAWHGHQVARDRPQAMVATVSLGEPRRFCLRPKSGGHAIRFHLGHGDLVVMGGTCQRTWEHTVPKTANAGPRIVLMFRPMWTSSNPLGRQPQPGGGD